MKSKNNEKQPAFVLFKQAYTVHLVIKILTLPVDKKHIYFNYFLKFTTIVHEPKGTYKTN